MTTKFSPTNQLNVIDKQKLIFWNGLPKLISYDYPPIR